MNWQDAVKNSPIGYAYRYKANQLASVVDTNGHVYNQLESGNPQLVDTSSTQWARLRNMYVWEPLNELRFRLPNQKPKFDLFRELIGKWANEGRYDKIERLIMFLVDLNRE